MWTQNQPWTSLTPDYSSTFMAAPEADQQLSDMIYYIAHGAESGKRAAALMGFYEES